MSGACEPGWHPRVVAGMNAVLAYWLPDPEHSVTARTLLALGYVLAAFCWLRASRRARSSAGDSGAGWWMLGAILLFMLAANKQFNLRGVFESGIRALAKAEHWYDRRRPMQFVVAVVVPAFLALATGLYLALKGRAFIRRHPLALAGWVLLFLYLVLRQSQEWKPVLPVLKAIRYHDWRLGLEATGLLLVILAALTSRPSPPPESTPDESGLSSR